MEANQIYERSYNFKMERILSRKYINTLEMAGIEYLE
jgi:hypothetical protein